MRTQSRLYGMRRLKPSSTSLLVVRLFTRHYTGLATMGHDVTGVDLNWGKVQAFRQGSPPAYEPGLADLINAALEQRKLCFRHTSEVFEPLGEAIVVTTGTPTATSGATDLSQVSSALTWIKEKQPNGGVIVMKSTVPPGSGVRLSKTALSGTTFKYIANPEFLR